MSSSYLDLTNCWVGSQNSGEHVCVRVCSKVQMNTQMKGCTGGGLGGSQVQQLLCPWGASWYGYEFTKVEALRTPDLWDFVEAPSCGHDLHNCISSPSPLPGEMRGGAESPSFYSWLVLS